MTSLFMRDAELLVSLAFFVATSIGCESKPEPATPEKTVEKETTTPKAKNPPSVPAQPGKFSPSFVKLVDGEHYDLDVHMQVDSCAECHGDIAAEWRDSTHALASISNPFYRAAFEDFAEKTGRDKAAFCGGCHDPGLMFDSAIAMPLKADDPRTHLGVSCNTCHGIKDATNDGNGSYTLGTSYVPLPKDGDGPSLAAHLKRVSQPALRTNALCVSCHKGFLSPDSGHDVFIPAIDEFGKWRGSGYNDNQTTRIVDVAPQNCVSCHMPEVGSGDDKHKSHRFPGGHTTLASMTGSQGQIDAVSALVKSAATVDIPAYGVGKQVKTGALAAPQAGKPFWFDVVIHNRNTGHFFPGGARDLRDTWVEVEIRNASGKRLGGAGLSHEKTGDDRDAYVLQAYMTTKEGTNVGNHSVHDFRAPAYAHSIAPRDSRIVRYWWTPGDDVDLTGATITARLRHRRLTESFKNSVCDFTKRDEDAEFQAAAAKYRGFKTLDACAPQPVIEIAEYTVALDGDAGPSPQAEWQRHYERVLGLQKHLQENLGETVDALKYTQSLLGEGSDAKARAKIHFELGRTHARMGRTQDAMDEFARAEKLVGDHPAIHYQRGLAHQRVFNNLEAVKWFEAASKLADDDRIWRQLAISAGSVDRVELSYEASQKGLMHESRDAHLLRNQMLALRRLDAPEAWKEDASKAFLSFKRDESAPHIRDKCSEKDDHCRRGRLPVRVIEIVE